MHTLNLRSFLWFATGVALTVTSIAIFGAWRANAAVTPGESTFVPVAPCRLFDTRPDQNVADSNTTPIGQTETRTQQVTGQVGNCDIPTGISGVAMNVTIVNPTADSFLVLFPAEQTSLPVGSNLNWTAGQSPTPNKVDVKLSPGGQVKIFNNTGTVDVLADIVGYYTTTTITQLTSDITALQTAVAQLTANGGTPNTDIADNAADITALQTALAQLTANGGTPDTGIADNAADITALEAAVTQLTANGGTPSTDIADNAADIAALEAAVAPLTANDAIQDDDIDQLQANDAIQDGDIDALEANDTAQDTDITALETNDTAQDTAIANNTANDTAQDLAITANTNTSLNNEGRLFDLEVRVNDVELLADSNGFEIGNQGLLIDDLLQDTNVIPSGVTVTGFEAHYMIGTVDNRVEEIVVELPGTAPANLIDVNFAASAIVSDADATCSGTAAAPTAPSGTVCLYVVASEGMDGVNGLAASQLVDRTFVVSMATDIGTLAPDSNAYLLFTWAYTAP